MFRVWRASIAPATWFNGGVQTPAAFLAAAVLPFGTHMNADADQTPFWDRAATTKVFSHALDVARFVRSVPQDAAVLDYGCGRGRLCGELAAHGGFDLLGADFSAEMIAAARRDVPGVQFQQVAGGALPFADGAFDAVLLFAVLTCIASSAAQRALLGELRRVLQPGGLLLVSDYPLQVDARNVARYEAFVAERGREAAMDDLPYGVFRLPDGALVRHHTPAWFDTLFSGFRVEDQLTFDAVTMNGNPARIAQWWLRA